MATDIIATIIARFPGAAARASGDHPAVSVPAAAAPAVLQAVREEFGYDFLVDVTAVDWGLEAAVRFTVVWHLFSTVAHGYLRVTADCTDNAAPAMASAVPLWPTANWHERETFDLLGITFTGHPDLRRILMWEGYPYHPLRKDFPLAGIEVPLHDPEIAAETGITLIAAPMAGGPFVASPGEMNLTEAEPRAKDESWNEASAKPTA